MTRDFGAGLSVDELIGLSAWVIGRLTLPRQDAFETVQKDANLLIAINKESYILMELWEDGHSTWQQPNGKQPLMITPTGQVIDTPA